MAIRAQPEGASFLNLCDGHALASVDSRITSARPLALASGDFNEDGVPDLVSGYGSARAGFVTVHRGSRDALWPYGPAVRSGPPAAFLPGAQTFELPQAPGFIATGDFDADGHWDIVATQRGSNVLSFLKGDGKGGFLAAKSILLPGNVATMISGEINRADGLVDLIVAVDTANGSRVLVFESPSGAVKGQPEVFDFANKVTALALGRFDGGAMNDLAVAAGNELVVIHARDRRLSSGATQRASVEPARVTRQILPFSVQALTAGDFTGTVAGVAALGNDGNLHFLDHAVAGKNLGAFQDPHFKPTFEPSRQDAGGRRLRSGGAMTPGLSARLEAMRQAAASGTVEWTERNVVTLPTGFMQTTPRMVSARVTGSIEEDLIAVDSGNHKIHVFSTISAERKNHAADPRSGPYSKPAAMRLLASLSATGAPAAVLPMRLNQHGLSGLVALQTGQSGPVPMPQDVPPANVFTVTNTSDTIIQSGTEYTGPAGSLRKAIFDANNATGTSSIVFNIPTTDPGYNAATRTFLIQPLSESVPGADNDFALPPINATVTIDGYSQPGASPNTLANGDNAKILIQIDGSKATTPGGSGLSPFDDVGSVYRGLDFTGWINPDITSGSSGQTASGAEGFEANGVQDFIEGNFFGTDPTGKISMANRIGIFADNGPGFGSTDGGNIIGGTTPQARNILSGNNNSGVLFLSTAYEAQLQGNFIGLDVTGKTIVSNPQDAERSNTFDGAGLNGATIIIGGTLPGTANVIAGNGTNVDINDLTDGNQANDSIVQGNIIGTDVTGTVAIPSEGYGVSILHNPTNMLIGGTTPAARNIISGNLAGVYIFDNSFNNLIQGNYIGLDITGAKAVANVNQGFISGATDSSEIPAGDTMIGGAVAGAGNVISGNTLDAIQISGTSTGQDNAGQTLQGSTIFGNFIGTDATGKIAVPNGGSGVDLLSSATNNVIGGTEPGSGNLIANNQGDGVHIDPGTAVAGEGLGNNTIANTILSNAGTGVRVVSGTNNRISQNSIYQNGALGIDTDVAGPNANTHCNSSNTGANNLQNSPVLTAGSGTAFITATATDPNGNTSEFSNAVHESLSGSVIDLLGSFDSTPSTTYTIEFFSSPVADPSGFGQGQTYLTSTTATTDANCSVTISNPIDTTKADVSVTLSGPAYGLQIGPDFGQSAYTGTIVNNGPATAHNVVFTETLPAGEQISSTYCDVASCQSPVVTTLGACTVSGNKITCNLGTMAPGATAQITLPIEATAPGTLTATATVSATEADPVPANNTATFNEAVTYPDPFIDHLDPASALTQTTGSLPLTIYGTGLLPTSAVTFNGTAVPTTGFLDNQVCGGSFTPSFCSAIQVSVPASLLGSVGTPMVTVTNPDPGEGGGSTLPSSAPFTLVSSCTYDVQFFGFNPIAADGDSLIPEQVEVTTNAPTCAWSATSDSTWLAIVDNQTGVGSGGVDVSVAPNTGAARSGHITVAGQSAEIDQSAGDLTICTFGLNPASKHFAATGGPGTFAVTTGSSCSYFVVANPQDGTSFITIPESSGLLVGDGNPVFTVAANHGAPRSNTIMVGGDVFPVTQDAPACYYTLSTTAATVGVSGGTGSIAVAASSASCAWTAKSSDTSHLTVTSGASATGNGTVKYSVPVNTSGPQMPTITIGDGTGYTIFTLTQVSAFTCTFSITPASIEVPSNGISSFFTVNASFNFCNWTAVSSDPSALAIGDVQGSGGLSTDGSNSGTGAVYYRVSQNTTGAPRTLTITAGCQTFTVLQDAVVSSGTLPAITTLQPSSATAGSAAFTLTVNGSNFVSGSVVNFNGSVRATTYVSATKLSAAILATDVATAGSVPVTVTNPAPGGGTSNAVTFTITAANNPTPAITTLQPSSITAGSAAVTLTVNGSNFVSGSVVNFNGSARVTTFVSATQITAAILASDVMTAGSVPVTVANPAPGGGASNAVTFTITAANNPTPAITTLQPSSAAAGSAAFTLTVNGSNFVSGSVVNFNGSARVTTYVSATKLSAAILATDVATAGSVPVTVTNPAPGGGTSNAVTFTITAANNPTPAITTLQPSSAAAGSAAFTLTVNGSNFVSGSVINFNGNARATTYVSATKLTAAVLATDVATAGSVPVTVANPAPGGGTSNAVTFTITAANNPTPAITTLQPSSTTAGSAAFTLTVNGSNFLSSSVVNFNGSARVTTYISATKLSAAILASDVASAGTATVTVANPAPGGGTSNAVTFNITAANNPTPVITTLQPASATAGSAAFTLTVNGSNFVSGSVVNFNGNARATTFVSATKLSAAILATDVATAGTAPITVASPVPGGGTSNAVTFTITAANNPTPAITTLQPVSATAGSAAFTLTVNGSDFVSGSVVNFTGNARATTFVSATQLSAAILASDIATAGTAPVTVTNPAPGGGTSNAVTFTITAAPAPQAVFSPTSLAFPSTVVGTAATAEVVTLSNPGNATLTISGITLTGTNSADFSQMNTCGQSLLAGSSCSISVSFTPAATGSFTATLSIADNASGSPQATSLSGTGVVAPSFTVTSSTPAQTIAPGGAAQYSITVSSQNGTFASAVTLSASGLPAGATASFAPASITPGSSSATSQLTIQTTTNLTANRSAWPIAASLLPVLGLFLWGRRRKRPITLMLLLLASLGAAITLTGCGGGFNFPSSPAKSYNVTITGTSGSEQQATTVQLTVQ